MTPPSDSSPRESLQAPSQGFTERRKVHLRFESHLLEVMSDAVITTDRHLRITTWNRAAERIYGWTKEETLGQSLDLLLQTEFLETTQRAAREQLLVHKSWTGVLRQRHKTGKTRYIQAAVTAIEEDGRLMGGVTVNRDITQLREADEELRVNEARWRDALEGSNEGVWDWDVLSGKVYFSPRWKSQLGYLPEEVGDSVEDWSSRVHPDDLPGALAALEACFRSDAGLYESEHRLRCKDGSYKWILDRGKVFERGPEGKALRVIGTHLDISARKQAEVFAQELSHRHQTLLQVASDGIHILDPQGRVVEANAAFCDMLGYSREELLGLSVMDWDANWSEVELRSKISELLEREDTFETLHRRKDGEIRKVEIHAKGMTLDGRRLLHASTRDITERKKTEAALRKSEERLGLALNATEDGVWDMDLVAGSFFGSPRWWAMVGLEPEELSPEPGFWRQLIHPDDLPRVDREFAEALKGGAESFSVACRFLHKDGHLLSVLTRGRIQRDENGKAFRISGINSDQTKITNLMARKEAERSSLELMALSVPLSEILANLVLGYEKAYPGSMASVLRLNPETRRLHQGAAPSLPLSYCQAIEGMEIGPGRGSCGTAAHTGQRVIVTDLRVDPLWADFRELALSHGLGACWSLPVFSPLGSVLGTVAVYYREPRTPDSEELEFLERCAHLISVAIQRHQETAQAKDANSLLERAGQIAQVGGWQLEVATGIIKASAGAYRIHELEATIPPTLEELIRFVAPEGRAVYAAAIEACLSVGKPWDLELPSITAKGRPIWIHSQGQAEQREGRTVRIFVTIQDVTQRAQAEKALEASESLHRTLVETLTEGVLLFNEQGVCINANEQACRILGAPREELLFKSPREAPPYRLQRPGGVFLEGDDLPVRACRMHGEVIQDLLLRVIRPGGSFAWILLNTRPLNTNSPVGLRKVVMSFTDITASHEAERARLESLQNLEELRSAIDQANIYALTDVAGRILDVNDEFVRISGYSREELIGADHRMLKSGTHPGTFYRELWKTITEGRIWRGEINNRAKDGHLYWVSTTIIPLRHPDGRPKGYMAFRQDMTEQHELQQALLQSQKLESVGTLVAGIAHDFNNILMSIGGFAEVLSAGKSLTPTQVKGLEVIRRAGERGRGLVSKLLNFSRKNAPKKVQANLNTAVSETAHLIKRGMPERVRLTLLLAENLPTTLMDPDQVHQVLMNLCVNAKDAILGDGELSMSTGLVVLSAEEAAKLSLAKGAYLCAAVSDTGQGIPAMVLSRMFEPFFTTKGVGKGTGLGLSVVHGIILGHGGAIQVESELGVGSTFKVYLPLLEPVPELEMEPVEPDSRGRLLLATLDGADPEMVELLRALRFEVVEMGFGEDWGTRIEWSDAALLVLDHEIGWASAARELRRGPKDVPVIVLTSSEDALFRVPSLHHPVSAVLTFPPRRGELVDTLNTLVPPLDNR